MHSGCVSLHGPYVSTHRCMNPAQHSSRVVQLHICLHPTSDPQASRRHFDGCLQADVHIQAYMQTYACASSLHACVAHDTRDARGAQGNTGCGTSHHCF